MAAHCTSLSQPAIGRIEKRLGKRRAIEPNSIYRGNHAGGNARVQYGNVFVQGDYHAVALDDRRAVTALDKCSSRDCAALIARLHFLADQCTTTLQTRHGTDMVAQSSAEDQLLTLLCWLRDVKTIPQQISENLPVFEDAFGSATFIDTRYITSWNVFESLLCNSMRERPGRHGLQRVKSLRYRLHDSKRGNIIDPRRDRNSFRYVFLPGRRVSMSMFFEWDEVSYDSCPRCHHEQVYMPDTETICANCNFIYRSLPAEELPEEQSPMPGPQTEERDRAIMSQMPLASITQELDKPEHFSRICIGAIPLVPVPDASNRTTCNDIWNQLQANEDFRNGKIDIDALCAELRTKARATEHGVLVDQHHSNTSLNKVAGEKSNQALERLPDDARRHETWVSATKQSASSYWSVPEQQDFFTFIDHFGTDFGAMARHMGTKTTTMIRNHYQRQVDGGRSDLKVAAESADRRRREGQYLGPAPQPTPILRRTYDNFPTRKCRAASPPEGENLIGGVSSGSDTDSSPIMFSPVPLVQRVQDAPEPELLENMADAVLYSNSIFASNSEEFLEPQPIRADFSTYDKQLSGRLGRSAREDDAISSANTSKIMAASTGWSLAYANASNGEGFNTHMRYMPPIWGPDQNSQTGLTQEQQNDLMHALESDGMGDVQRMISQTLRDDTWSNSSSAGGPIVPTTLNVGDWYEFFGIPNGSDIK